MLSEKELLEPKEQRKKDKAGENSLL